MKRIFLIILLAGFALTCSKKVMVNVQKPARYDVSDVQRIAVFDFKGPKNSGEIIASKFTNKLWQAQYFSVMERKELQKVLEEHALQMSGVVDNATVVEYGKIIGVDGIILGNVSAYKVDEKRGREKVKEKVWKGEYEKDKDGNFVYEKTRSGKKKKKVYVEEYVSRAFINRTVTVGIDFRLVSVQTGEIRASDSKTRSNNKKHYLHKGAIPAADQILDNLSENIIAQFIPLITPHNVRVAKEFEEGNDQVDLGIEYAQKNLWDRAKNIWEAEVQRDPGNAPALYNLGIAYEVLGDLDKADQLYNKALDIEPNELYMEAVSNIRQRKAEQKKLEKQLKH
jgi:tetratricopeptide (TPR) repeat protein